MHPYPLSLSELVILLRDSRNRRCSRSSLVALSLRKLLRQPCLATEWNSADAAGRRSQNEKFRNNLDLGLERAAL